MKILDFGNSPTQVMDRLDQMIENAIKGQPIEQGFDESIMSALETKLSRYLAMTQTTHHQMAAEKNRVHQLISDISHQTKTPIANLVLYAQLLEEAQLDPQVKVLVESIAAQSNKLNFLIGALLKASRLESGIVAVSPSPQPLQPLLDGAAAQVATLATQRQIDLAIRPTTVWAAFDLKWSMEMLTNILENALKYTPPKGHVTLTVTPFDLFCRMDVEDDGMGIAEKDLNLIFSRFYRSPDVASIEGVGIGLFLAREIIQKQGGYIKVASELGKGSRFSIYFPLHG